jgi:hypothetical protein
MPAMAELKVIAATNSVFRERVMILCLSSFRSICCVVSGTNPSAATRERCYGLSGKHVSDLSIGHDDIEIA